MPKILLILIAISVIAMTSCAHERQDRQNPWLGRYTLTTITYADETKQEDSIEILESSTRKGAIIARFVAENGTQYSDSTFVGSVQINEKTMTMVFDQYTDIDWRKEEGFIKEPVLRSVVYFGLIKDDHTMKGEVMVFRQGKAVDPSEYGFELSRRHIPAQ